MTAGYSIRGACMGETETAAVSGDDGREECAEGQRSGRLAIGVFLL